MIKVGRAIEGISINGKEWLLNSNNEIMEFKSIKDAILFLKENGYEEQNEDYFYDTFTFEEIN